ncbi:hypothetical protein P7C70_g7187, partial [Phenoliferia sp. Uapishka_3]
MARRNNPTASTGPSTSNGIAANGFGSSASNFASSHQSNPSLSHLSAGPLPSPVPSPSKSLVHPTVRLPFPRGSVEPRSSIMRAQQAEASQSFASASAFKSEPTIHHPTPRMSLPLPFNDLGDESDASEVDIFPHRNRDDITDYALDSRRGEASSSSSEISGAQLEMGTFQNTSSSPKRRNQGSLSTPFTPEIEKAWAFDTSASPFGNGRGGSIDSASAYPYHSSADSWSRPKPHLLIPKSTNFLSRLASRFGIATTPTNSKFPNLYRSTAGHSISGPFKSHSPLGSRRRFQLPHLLSPKTFVLLAFAALVVAVITVLGSGEIQFNDPTLKDVKVDATLLGGDGADYAGIIKEIKAGSRKPSAKEKKLLEMDARAKEEASVRGRLASLLKLVVPATEQKVGKKSPGGTKGKKVITVTRQPGAKKKPTGVGNILGLDQVPRRYRYGANFQPSTTKSKDSASNPVDPSSDEENDNAKVSTIPTEAQLAVIFESERERYHEEESFWRSFSWKAPPVHRTLSKFISKLDPEELRLRDWIRDMRTQPRPEARNLGLSAMGPTGPGEAASSQQAVEDADADDGDDSPVVIEVEIIDADVGDPQVGDPQLAYEPEVEAAPAEVARHRLLQRRLSADDDSASAKLRARARVDRKPSSAKLRELTPSDFVGGNLVKWGALMTESKEELGGTCEGANWLYEYQQLHDEMRSGERTPKFISYHCERGMNCGGLGDRLLGMTSAFFFGLITNRAFLAEWQTPVPLEIVFDSPFIDWSFSSFTSDQDPVLSNWSSKAADLDIIHFNKDAIDATFGKTSWAPPPSTRMTKGMEMRDLAFQSPWIRLFTNRGMIYRSFSYSHLQNRVAKLKLKPLKAFSCILNYLFRPKPEALGFISDYSSVFALPSVFSIGVQIRTGDASMKDPDYDATNTVDVHSAFFKCADQLAETYALPDQKILYYLVTDSMHLRDDAIRKFGDKVVVTGAGIEHIHQRSGHADGVFNAVLEEWILAKTDYRVITQDSGFGKLATFASGQKSTTVSIFPSQNLDVVGLQSKNSHTKVDCRLESAFSSFDDLSSEWSLG